jgi:carboxyl-terminal processing protease
MLRKRLTWLSVGFIFGIALSSSALHAFTDQIYRALEQFSKVLYYVENDYVDPVDEKTLIQGAIKGMLGTLDPHSIYLTPDIYRELKVDTVGKFGGVGLEVTLKDGILTVVAPIEGTPADRAGIHTGDRVVKIDGQITKDMNLSDAVKKMRGNRKGKVVLTLYRDGWKEAHEFTLQRETINVKSVRSELIDGKYAYARITSFQERTQEDLLKALNAMQKSANGGLKGIIIDLRNNPRAARSSGGVVYPLSKHGVIVSTQGRTHKMDERRATGKAPFPDIPVAILVNGGSASRLRDLRGGAPKTMAAVI